MSPQDFLKKFIPTTDIQKYSPHNIAGNVFKLAAQAMHVDAQTMIEIMLDNGYIVTERKNKQYLNISPENGNELYYLRRTIPKTTSAEKYNRLRKKQILYFEMIKNVN